MILRRIGLTYLVALAIFLAIDAVWLGVVAVDFYQREIGHLLAERPNLGVAAVFYLVFVSGILVFGVRPGRPFRTTAGVAGCAALFGFYTYVTYELTNMATLPAWPLRVVVIDVVWGVCLSTAVAVGAYRFERWACGD